MSEGTRQGGQPTTPERPAGDIVVIGKSVTYGEAGTDEHVLQAEVGLVGMGDPEPEEGEPIVYEDAAPIGDMPAKNSSFTFDFNTTWFSCDPILGWSLRDTANDQ